MEEKIISKINWNAVMAIATLLYAIFTVLMWDNMNRQVEQASNAFKETQKSIRLQDSSFNLQKEFYQRTIRPFIYVDSVAVHDAPESHAFVIDYWKKNVGQIPYKELKSMAWLDSIPMKVLWSGVDWTGTVFTHIFPNERKFARTVVEYTTLEEIWKKLYIHVLVTYKDPAGMEYQYYRIFLMDKYYINNRLHIDFANIWDDFN